MLFDRLQTKREETTNPGGKLCDPDGQAKRIMEIGNIGDEILCIGTIIVHTSEINLEGKVIKAITKEICDTHLASNTLLEK